MFKLNNKTTKIATTKQGLLGALAQGRTSSATLQGKERKNAPKPRKTVTNLPLPLELDH